MRLWPAIFLTLPLFAQQQEAREILKQLIEINTTDSVGDNTKAAEAMAARFREAGYPASDIQILDADAAQRQSRGPPARYRRRERPASPSSSSAIST